MLPCISPTKRTSPSQTLNTYTSAPGSSSNSIVHYRLCSSTVPKSNCKYKHTAQTSIARNHVSLAHNLHNRCQRVRRHLQPPCDRLLQARTRRRIPTQPNHPRSRKVYATWKTHASHRIRHFLRAKGSRRRTALRIRHDQEGQIWRGEFGPRSARVLSR